MPNSTSNINEKWPQFYYFGKKVHDNLIYFLFTHLFLYSYSQRFVNKFISQILCLFAKLTWMSQFDLYLRLNLFFVFRVGAIVFRLFSKSDHLTSALFIFEFELDNKCNIKFYVFL